MQLSRTELLRILRQAGLHDRVVGHEDEIPDVIDTDRDRALFERFGLDRGFVMERMGSSP